MIRIRVMGVCIESSFWFVAFLTCLLLFDQTGIVFYGILAAILHEMGHVVALLLFGCKPKKLSFELSGISLVENRYKLSYYKELLVLSAGCIVNFLFFAVFWHFGFLSFATTHFCIGVFNLLPSKVLDGGRILSLILFHHITAQRADQIFNLVSSFVALSLVTGGGLLFTQNKNPTLLVTGLYLLLHLFSKKEGK